MYAKVEKPKRTRSRSITNTISQKQSRQDAAFQFVDNRPEAIAQRKHQKMVDNSPQVKQLAQLSALNVNCFSVNGTPNFEMGRGVIGKKAVRLNKNNASKNVVQGKISPVGHPVIQRKALVDGVAVEKHLQSKGQQLPTNIPKDWLKDQYYRDYHTLAEFYAHALGLRVQVGLEKSLGIWYRLPLPGAGKVLTPQFFLMGELHNIFPVRNLVKESNQNSSHIISERGASFRKTAYDNSGLRPEKLAPKGNNPKEHLAELGLAKALFAFANQFAPEKEDRSGIRMNPDLIRHQIGDAETPVDKPTRKDVWEGGSVEAWEQGAQKNLPLYRSPVGIPYFMITHKNKTIAFQRPNVSSASGYSMKSATGNFLQKQEIVQALPEEVAKVYLDIVEGRLTSKASDYSAKYNEVFEALRKASAKNLNTVYPGMKPVLRENPTKKNKGKSKKHTDIELAMNHRNTAMVEALMMAYGQGGYVMASLGNQHVIDIKKYFQEQDKLPFLIITYSDFINKYSKSALFGKEKEVQDEPEMSSRAEQSDQSSSKSVSGPIPNPWKNAPGPDPLFVEFIKVSKLYTREAQTRKWRLADKLIQKYGNNTRALQIGLEAQSTSDLINLRDSYQTDIDLVLGYEDRVDEKIQKNVISLINEILEQRLSNKPHRMIDPTYHPDVY